MVRPRLIDRLEPTAIRQMPSASQPGSLVGISNSIRSRSAATLAAAMAPRREQSPAATVQALRLTSEVVSTTKVAAIAGPPMNVASRNPPATQHARDEVMRFRHPSRISTRCRSCSCMTHPPPFVVGNRSTSGEEPESNNTRRSVVPPSFSAKRHRGLFWTRQGASGFSARTTTMREGRSDSAR